MGPVNWWAVLVAAAVARSIWWWWQRRARRSSQGFVRRGIEGATRNAAIMLLLLLSAAMLGHMYARLAVAPAQWHLYFMLSGGQALGFVLPAVWIGARTRGDRRSLSGEALVWLAIYLAMGAVFLAFAAWG